MSSISFTTYLYPLKQFLTTCIVFMILLIAQKSYAQNSGKGNDTVRIKAASPDTLLLPKSGFGSRPFNPIPDNFGREVEYDAVNKRYIIRKKIGGRFYSTPEYLSVKEYDAMIEKELKLRNWKTLSDAEVSQVRSGGLIPQIEVRSKAFQKIFGGSTIDIQPRGEAQLNTVVRINKNQNPLFNEKQRTQIDFNVDEKIQMDLIGSIGNNLKMKLNYNTTAGFDFENQKKLDYTGGEDDVIKKIELGNVSMPLNSSLIRGSQSLFGIKTQLQIGRLNVTSVFSQQKSLTTDIRINNGAQQSEFNISADTYEANKHFFLGQYFRENYNRFSSNPLLISSGINITKVEVWVTNKSGSTQDSRDVLGLLDLAENTPWNSSQLTGGFSVLPSAFDSDQFPRQSNNLLAKLPAGSRLSSSNQLISFFAGSGGTDNFAKMTYARKLTMSEFTFHAQLGYISLIRALNADEILAVAYRYTKNGVEYQVGEFSADVPFNPSAPNMLYAKLLKNETIKTALPTWGLMMKNIYSIGGYKINPANFQLNITRLENSSGIESPLLLEGSRTANKRWLNITGLDQLNQQQERKPDGIFDFMAVEQPFAVGASTAVSALSGTNTALANLVNSANGVSTVNLNNNGHQGYITIDPQNGRIIFPVTEPFGKDLASQFAPSEQALIGKYTFQALYDSTRVIAQQLFPGQNRFVIRGSYESAVSSEFYLNAANVEPGGVKVYAGTVPLVEGVDFAVDYQGGRVTILNTALLASGQNIRISTEDSDSFGRQQRTVFGTHLDYKISNKLNIGATYMSLSEKPISQKVNYGQEPLANSMWGMDVNYSSDSKMLTRWLNKLPYISTKVPSAISFSAEFANLVPGHPSALNTGTEKKGVSYLDDFEDSESVVDLKTAAAWQLSGTPQLFPESGNMNDLSYGFNRAKIAFYNIDPSLYQNGSSLQPEHLRTNLTELSNHFVRRVIEQEVFPYKEVPTSRIPDFPILNLAYYPTLRGPYNYTTIGVGSNGNLLMPKSRWGGMLRRIETNDFEALNVGYIEMWIMDPNIYKPNSAGGDLYLNLGNISEDILKDGRKSLENGLSAEQDPTKYDETVWGRVPRLQPVIPAFENDPAARKAQDVGLDGLANADEQTKFAAIINQLKAQLNPDAASKINIDPSSDDYHYFRGADLDQAKAGILKRYENYNGTEGNSKTTQQSREELGLETSASTALPDGEDVNRDNNMTQSDEYFQYRVSLRPADLVIGKNFVTDKVVSQVKLANGSTQNTAWYQIRVPIGDYEQKVGGITDFKSIRFMRLFMTNFEDTAIVRFAKLQLVRGDWRQYNAKNEALKVIADPLISPAAPDQSSIELSTVNIEENGKRSPIPYVVPPDITRERDFSNYQGDTRMNEQSLAVTVRNLKDGYTRTGFKTGYSDFRSYKRLELFVHLEALGNTMLNDNDLSAVLRIGTDNQDNYYEYVQPLAVTQPGSAAAAAIWPEQNKIDILLELFQQAKIARNRARQANGAAWDLTVPYAYTDGERTIFVKGQPDMSKVRIYMLGLKNPLKNTTSRLPDDGLEKSAIAWFNELRLTEFDQQGGWAATARLNAKLADIGEVNIAGSKSTVGFGALDARVSERSRADQASVDVSAGLELGKFLPPSAQVKVPVFINYSRQIATPQYDPRMPDIELKKSLEGASSDERKAILEYAQDYTSRNGIAFTNVRKERGPNADKPRIWDIENFSASYAFTKFLHHDFINENNVQKNYNGSLAYHYTGDTKNIRPFDKLIKSNLLAIFRDINFNPLPNAINFRLDANRYYSENSLRNNDPLNAIPVNTTYNKNFLITRVYGISWNLTKSFTVDFDATNYSIIDEPDGRIEGLKRDTVWNNLKRLGRNTDYSHNLNLGYALPINKLPYMDWFNVVARYGTNFNWQTEPLATLRDPSINLGNTIQNSRTIQINPSLNFITLYNKFGSYRKGVSSGYDGIGGSQFLLNLLTSIKTINGAYTQTKGIYLPGYLPVTNYLGLENVTGAPGLGFVFGSQKDIRNRALQSGWLTTDTLQYQLYVNTLREDLSVAGVIEPFKGFRVTLSANKTSNRNYSSNLRYDNATAGFANLSPIASGDYSISFISIKTLFADKGNSRFSTLYNNFMAARAPVSRRLGSANPNSRTGLAEFADGYDKNSQDVVVAAFMSAYTGKNPYRSGLSAFPKIPLPNWRINYNGLSKWAFLSDYFQSVDLRHAYRSIYSVNGFNSLQRYDERAGASSVRDENFNFLPQYQFAQVTIAETLSPLIGIDARFKNNVSMNFEVGKTRLLGLSLANSQLAQLSENNLILGLGYRTNRFRFPFGLFRQMKMDNNMDFKLETAIRDNKTMIYRADVNEAEVSAGAKNITMRPSVNYILNSRFNFQFYYDTNINKPYTSAAFRTSSSNIGFSLRMTMN